MKPLVSALSLFFLMFQPKAALTDHPRSDDMEIYYINLKTSADRDTNMRRHLKKFPYPFFRVDAVNIGEYEHFDLRPYRHPCETVVVETPLLFHTRFLDFKYMRINRLCIAPRNEIKEIVVTLSHLKAVYTALMSNNSYDYALILEDDMTLQFEVDFKSFIQTLPNDFGALQLFVINKSIAGGLLRFFLKNVSSVSWKPAYWSAGGYIINKPVLRKELAGFLRQKGDTLEVDLLAGSDRKSPIFMRGKHDSVNTSDYYVCYPKMCCDGLRFIRKFPCVLSKDVAADYYIYSLSFGNTYTTTIPILKGSSHALNSTISMNHSLTGGTHLRKAARIINRLLTGKLPLPPFLKIRSDLIEES